MTTTPLISPLATPPITSAPQRRWNPRSIAILTLFWGILQIGGLFSPGLLDDVDSVYIQIAREMLQRHDYVTPYINGIRFFDKPPLMYWMAAASMRVFGIHDWAARLPLALAVLALLLAVYALGIRLFASISPAANPDRGGFYAALALATSIGPYLYTRFYIPDILLALWMTLAVHLFLIALDRLQTQESPQIRVPHPLQSHRKGWGIRRVPHSSQSHRDEWVHRAERDPLSSTEHKGPGAPSFAVSSQRVGEHDLDQPGFYRRVPHSSQSHRAAQWRVSRYVSQSALLPCLALAAVMALNVLTKGLIGLVFPIAFVLLYLAITRQLHLLKKLHLLASTAVFLAIAAPWHILAALRTPAIPMPTGFGLPAKAGWAWFYLYNEHIARFLGKRIPHDYGQTPVWLFWLFAAIWITPWITFIPSAVANHLRTLRSRLVTVQNRVPHSSQSHRDEWVHRADRDPLSSTQHKGPGAPSFAVSSQRVGEHDLDQPEFYLGVPHSSQSHRDEWVHRAEHDPLSSTEHKGPGAPSFAVSSQRVGEHDLDQPGGYRDKDAKEAALALLLWSLLVLGFFSLSSRQEYYSLPAIPALALMVGGLLTGADIPTNPSRKKARNWHLYFLVPLTTLIAAVCGYFALTAPHPPPGTDIATLVNANPEFYNLSLGHLFDLTADAMGLFRGPLTAVALSMLGIGIGSYLLRRRGLTYAANLALAAAMTVTLLAAHEGLARFYPILGSKELALSINQVRQVSPKPDDLIILDGELTSGSTLIFYTGQQAHLINGHVNGLWYGSFWPDAPRIFETDSTLHQLWASPRRIFLLTYNPTARTPDLTPYGPVHTLAAAGGKTILTNR